MIFGQNVIKNEVFKNNKRVTVSHFQTHPSILCFVMVEQGLCKRCFCFTSCSRLDFVTRVGGGEREAVRLGQGQRTYSHLLPQNASPPQQHRFLLIATSR